MRFLQAAFDRAGGKRPAVGEVLVVPHAGAVALEIVGALTDALDDLANLAEENAQGSVDNPKVGLQASLCMEAISGLPEFLQHVNQIQDQGDVEFLVDSNLERTFPIRQGQTGHGPRGIAAVHLFSHLLDHGGLALEQTGPYPFVLGAWGGGPSSDAGREVGKGFR